MAFGVKFCFSLCIFFPLLFLVICENVGIEKVVETIDSIPKVNWDFEGIHYFDNGPLTVQYLFVLDALNFCFWPGILFLCTFHCNIIPFFCYLFWVIQGPFILFV